MTNKPIAVLLSDVHFDIHTLQIADQATRMAVETANSYMIPLIIAGDLHNTKSHLRGECVSAILKTLEECKLAPIILVGNHCRVNEKVKEHSLEFLRSSALIVDDFEYNQGLNLYLISYECDSNRLRSILADIPKGSTIVMHQGVQGAAMGDYIVDKSAISKEDLAGYRVISGHYHTRQQFKLPEGGLFDYLGNPYTLGFGEAKDPAKGFQLLYKDGSLEFVPTNLRKHVIITDDYQTGPVAPNDIVLVKTQDPTATKESLALKHNITQDFRLELLQSKEQTELEVLPAELPKEQAFDRIIDNSNNLNEDDKSRLKELWRLLHEDYQS